MLLKGRRRRKIQLYKKRVKMMKNMRMKNDVLYYVIKIITEI